MRFPANTLARDCEDTSIPWTDEQRQIFMVFCDRFSVVRTVKERTSRCLHRGEDTRIFDHTNAWFDVNGRIVVSTCPYHHITADEVREYALWEDWILEELRALAAKYPERKKWQDVRGSENFTFLDHIFVAPRGYHHPDTILIVLDADAMDMLKVIRHHEQLDDICLVNDSTLYLRGMNCPHLWNPEARRRIRPLYEPLMGDFIRPVRHWTNW